MKRFLADVDPEAVTLLQKLVDAYARPGALEVTVDEAIDAPVLGRSRKSARVILERATRRLRVDSPDRQIACDGRVLWHESKRFPGKRFRQDAPTDDIAFAQLIALTVPGTYAPKLLSGTFSLPTLLKEKVRRLRREADRMIDGTLCHVIVADLNVERGARANMTFCFSRDDFLLREARATGGFGPVGGSQTETHRNVRRPERADFSPPASTAQVLLARLGQEDWAIGSAPPPLSAVDPDGKPIDLKAFVGEPVLIWMVAHLGAKSFPRYAAQLEPEFAALKRLRRKTPSLRILAILHPFGRGGDLRIIGPELGFDTGDPKITVAKFFRQPPGDPWQNLFPPFWMTLDRDGKIAAVCDDQRPKGEPSVTEVEIRP